MIGDAVLMGGGINADGESHQIGEDDGADGDDHGQEQPVADDLRDREVVFEGVTEIPLGHTGDPHQVLLDQRFVEAILPAQEIEFFLVDGFTLTPQFVDQRRQIVARRQLDDDEYEDADGKQRRHHDEHAVDQICEHDGVTLR